MNTCRHGCRTTHRPDHGFTLIELIITLSVALFLAMISTEWLPGVVQENRMTSGVNQLAAGLHLARSEAVKRGRRVVLCPTPDQLACGNSADWPLGWMLFPSDNDRERDSDEPVLQTGPAQGPGVTLRTSNHRKRIVYQPDGSAGGSNASFTFCGQDNRARPRVICLSNTGRPRLRFTTCSRRPIRCP